MADSLPTHSQSFWDDVVTKLKTDSDAIKSLLRNKEINLDEADSFGKTLLDNAAFYGNHEIAQLCINLGANVKGKYSSLSAADYAKKSKFHHIEQLVLLSEMKANIGQRINEISTSINKQNGITENILNELSFVGEQTKHLVLAALPEIMINSISKKLVFSDDLLYLCWKVETMNGDPLKSELWQTIKRTCTQIITATDKRDWFWLKNHLVTSNIWFTQNADGNYLYYKLLEIVQEESQNQINKLQKDIKTQAVNDEQSWHKLIKMEAKSDQLVTLVPILRQDNAPNGLPSKYTKQQLHESATNASFDGAQFYDHHLYLSQLSLLAQTLDAEFQKSVQSIFKINKQTHLGTLKRVEECKHDDDGDILVVEYNQGPVKLLSRGRAKATNDYFDQTYPTSACVLDFNRCSLVFPDITSLLFGVDLFIQTVTSAQHESGSIIGITRIKNGFKEYVQDGPRYADIKVNVLIKGRTNNIVGEVQFLVQKMKAFKTIAHNLYSIEREEEFISSSVRKILPALTDVDKQIKVSTSLGDAKRMIQIMVHANKTLQDILLVDKERRESLLHSICKSGNVKVLIFVQGLMTNHEFMHHLFMSNLHPIQGTDVWEVTPIEDAIWTGNEKTFKYVLNLKDVRTKYEKEKKWQYRAIYQVFAFCADLNSIDALMAELGLNEQDLMVLLDYEYENKQSWFYRFPLVGQMVWDNNVNILRYVLDKMNSEQRLRHVLMVDPLNQNALERAVVAHKVDIIQYLFGFDEIKEEVLRNKELLWRIVFWLTREKKKEMTNYLVSKLKLTQDSLNSLILYRVPRPEKYPETLAHNACTYWNYTISKDAIDQLMTVSWAE